MLGEEVEQVGEFAYLEIMVPDNTVKRVRRIK